MIAVAAEHGLPGVVMHMRGRPHGHYEVDQTYEDIGGEVRAFLLERASALEAAGAPRPWLDPGFEFAKSLDDNLRLLGDLPTLAAEGYPVLVSASRKGFLAEALGHEKRQDTPGPAGGDARLPHARGGPRRPRPPRPRRRAARPHPAPRRRGAAVSGVGGRDGARWRSPHHLSGQRIDYWMRSLFSKIVASAEDLHILRRHRGAARRSRG